MLVLVTDSLASCLHFIRLFWNHTLTWLSDKPSIAASWCLSAFVKYFCTWKRFSSPFRCKLENTARVQGLLGLRDRACPWIDWVHISDEVDGCLLLQLVKGSNKRNIDYFMESVRVRYLCRSCWRIRKRMSQRSERVSLLIQKQRTKQFPYCHLFILFLLRFSPSTRFSPFIQQSKCQLFLFRQSPSTLSLVHSERKIFTVNIFRSECFTRYQFASLALIFSSRLLLAPRHFEIVLARLKIALPWSSYRFSRERVLNSFLAKLFSVPEMS